MSFDTSEFQNRKSALRIVIFGSYDSVAIPRLETLKNCLVADGYAATLVKELEYPVKLATETDDEFNVRSSFYWLEYSGANFLVFLRGVRNDGVAMELGEVCSSYPAKLPLTRVFYEDGPEWFSSMIRGSVSRKKIIRYVFTTDEVLCDFAKAAALNLLIQPGY